MRDRQNYAPLTREIQNIISLGRPTPPDPSSPYDSSLDDDSFKVGRRTGFTRGQHDMATCVSTLKSWLEGDAGNLVFHPSSDRYVVSGKEAMYAKPGDSGAFAVDSEGQLMGMIWGGCNFTGNAFFTAMEDIITDIKHMTGAVDVRLP